MDLSTLVSTLRSNDHEGELLFLLPVRETFPQKSVDFLTGELRLMLLDFTLGPVEPHLWKDVEGLGAPRELHALFVPGRKTETVRSILKAAFWPPPAPCAPLTYAAVTGGDALLAPLDFDLKHAGWFFPFLQLYRVQGPPRELPIPFPDPRPLHGGRGGPRLARGPGARGLRGGLRRPRAPDRPHRPGA